MDILRLLRRAGYEPVAWMQDQSPSGTGWHVIIHVEPCPETAYEVVALEAICGGDRNREAMQMHRARCLARVPKWMRDAWNVLYAPHPHRQRHVKGILVCGDTSSDGSPADGCIES